MPRSSLALAERALERGALSVRGFDRVAAGRLDARRPGGPAGARSRRGGRGPRHAPAAGRGMTLDEDLEDAAAAPGGRLPTGEVHPGLRRARAWLSRVTEPGTIDFWRFVDAVGPVEAARQLRSGRAPARIRSLVGARAQQDETLADFRRAERCGARLIVPEDDEWPALPLHALTVAVSSEPDDHRQQSDRTLAPGSAGRPVGARPGPPGRARRAVGRDRRVAGVDGVRRARRRRAGPPAGGAGLDRGLRRRLRDRRGRPPRRDGGRGADPGGAGLRRRPALSGRARRPVLTASPRRGCCSASGRRAARRSGTGSWCATG